MSTSGFHVDEGAYDTYARAVDPHGEAVRRSTDGNVSSNVELGGDGFSAMGSESGFAGAYTGRMRALQERLGKLGGNWTAVGEAARRTGANYDVVEADQSEVMTRIGKELG
ncbi:hypothetical protein BJF85_20485 [Saccharomonospora sp. CUA-673]|uniref:hypothetical protein n=1 Tax=Saccharomonospora sp. CUA-673 TaxID=1904969 RepID=UPI00095E67D3|nr:hypothetical protein [Saccharomonospora sp. CUA-673]OLT44118.1 hypothetical protein BJF85_20485 [Saccharomonospora sp. CUA-673]